MVQEEWFAGVRAEVARRAPDLMPLYEVYEGEARFGRQYIARDLAALAPGRAILEVGAGCMLLSCQLVREGFRVTALEPLGSGFSHLSTLRAIVMAQANAMDCVPLIIERRAEDLRIDAGFDYAFSVNVMEHVDSVAASLEAVCDALRSGASYRFTCPNYLFPYEPHFNMPTMFSKRLTGFMMRRRISAREAMPDAAGVWRSLNWINPLTVRRGLVHRTDVRVAFDRKAITVALERMTTDPVFAQRRSPIVARMLSALVASRLHRLFEILPVTIQPLIDCMVVRTDQGV